MGDTAESSQTGNSSPQPTAPKDANAEAAQQCPICLTKEFVKKSHLDNPSCIHWFCFECIEQWTMIKAACPLCRQKCTAILTPNEEGGEDRYIFPSPAPYQPVRNRAPVEAPFYEFLQLRQHIIMLERRVERLENQYRTAGGLPDASFHKTYLENISEQIRNSNRQLAVYRTMLSEVTGHNRAYFIRHPTFRSLVYDRSMNARPLPHAQSRHPIDEHKEDWARLNEWLMREFKAVMPNEAHDRKRMRAHVKSVMRIATDPNQGINSAKLFEYLTKVLTGTDPLIFKDEFVKFAKSGMEVQDYDAAVDYKEPGTETVNRDEVIDDELAVVAESSNIQHRNRVRNRNNDEPLVTPSRLTDALNAMADDRQRLSFLNTFMRSDWRRAPQIGQPPIPLPSVSGLHPLGLSNLPSTSSAFSLVNPVSSSWLSAFTGFGNGPGTSSAAVEPPRPSSRNRPGLLPTPGEEIHEGGRETRRSLRERLERLTNQARRFHDDDALVIGEAPTPLHLVDLLSEASSSASTNDHRRHSERPRNDRYGLRSRSNRRTSRSRSPPLV